MATPSGPYPRSARTPRGEARRAALLDLVADDLLAHGLTDFSLRRAARAAGTTHKVLLYHFDGAEDLLAQAVAQLRARRIDSGLAAALATPGRLSDKVRALWPVLTGAEADAMDQAVGLAMYDPARYGGLATSAVTDYLPPLIALCPDTWSPERRDGTARLVLTTLRGLVLARRTSPDDADVEGTLAALCRVLDREEDALDTK